MKESIRCENLVEARVCVPLSHVPPCLECHTAMPPSGRIQFLTIIDTCLSCSIIVNIPSPLPHLSSRQEHIAESIISFCVLPCHPGPYHVCYSNSAQSLHRRSMPLMAACQRPYVSGINTYTSLSLLPSRVLPDPSQKNYAA